jgi:hypothetical protein
VGFLGFGEFVDIAGEDFGTMLDEAFDCRKTDSGGGTLLLD